MEQSNNEQARKLQERADMLTDLRLYGSIAIAASLAVDGPNWPSAGATAALCYTDRLDGQLARKAAALQGTETSQTGSERDHRTDKYFYYAMMAGMTVWAYRQKRYGQTLLYAANMAVVTVRDSKMAQFRERANNEGKDTKAQGPGKLKTAVQMSAITLGTSPVSESPLGKMATETLVVAGSALSIFSYKTFKRNLSKII